jgi:hypothetical protein
MRPDAPKQAFDLGIGFQQLKYSVRGNDQIEPPAQGKVGESELQQVNHALLAILNPGQIEVEIWREDELSRRRGLSSELDEMWSYVARKTNPRWLWHAIDHRTGKVLAYEEPGAEPALK